MFQTYNNYCQIHLYMKMFSFTFYTSYIIYLLKRKSSNINLLIKVWYSLKRTFWVISLFYASAKLEYRFDVTKFLILDLKDPILIKTHFKDNKSLPLKKLLLYLNYFKGRLLINAYRVTPWFNASSLTNFLKFYIERKTNIRLLTSLLFKSTNFKQRDRLLNETRALRTRYGQHLFKINGCKLRIAGRLYSKRSKISKTLKFQKGKLQLNSLQNVIDFYQSPALTQRGSLGISIWITYSLVRVKGI